MRSDSHRLGPMGPVPKSAVEDDPIRVLTEALVDLHEQAHGQTPIRTCMSSPCRGLKLTYSGPAPRTAGLF